jgi:hypothetical protein
MADVKQRSQKLGKPSDEQSKALEKKYYQPISSAANELQEQALRVAKEPYGKDLLEVLKPKDKPAKQEDKDKPKDVPK